MKRENEIKELLIQNTIHLIATYGFERATTKELTFCGGNPPDFKMNEVYIYRLFGSKENLYDAAFLRLSSELYDSFESGIDGVGGFEENAREKLNQVFLSGWALIMKNEERCRCYVRYYYSVYLKGESFENHKKHFVSLVSKIKPYFNKEADSYSILQSVFTTMLSFAIRVYNGELPNNDDTRTHVFNVLYHMMAPYFRENKTE